MQDLLLFYSTSIRLYDDSVKIRLPKSIEKVWIPIKKPLKNLDSMRVPKIPSFRDAKLNKILWCRDRIEISMIWCIHQSSFHLMWYWVHWREIFHKCQTCRLRNVVVTRKNRDQSKFFLLVRCDVFIMRGCLRNQEMVIEQAFRVNLQLPLGG